jgi:4-hydroxybenzoyl-CoA thioesterase
MRRSTFHKHRIAFADCDPAQSVFFANYFKWFDTSGFEFFVACGVPPWRDTAQKGGIIGTPLVKATATFVNSATYGEDVEIESWVHEWRTKSFVMHHVARRGDTVLAEGEDIRVFAIMDPEHPTRIRAVPIPPEIRALCE